MKRYNFKDKVKGDTSRQTKNSIIVNREYLDLTNDAIDMRIINASGTVVRNAYVGAGITKSRVQLVVDAAPAALNTLNELAAALGDDPNFATTVTNLLTNKVDYTIVQSLTAPQQLQACQNIGVGDPERDFVADYTTARDS